MGEPRELPILEIAPQEQVESGCSYSKKAQGRGQGDPKAVS